MSKQKIGAFLFERIRDHQVEWTFGIPGDFVLPIYAAQAQSHLKTVVMSHEPAVGFAADAYARIKGLGVALVTYGVGGLNMVNATACAYAEQSPLLVVSGAPETRSRSGKAQLHHCVKSFASQYKVYEEVTEVQTLIDTADTAQESIDYVLDTVKTTSRPGYIEFSRDLVSAEIDLKEKSPSQASTPSKFSDETLDELLKFVIDRLKGAKQAALFAGAQLARFRLMDKVVQIATVLNLPVVTSILGKTAFPESHPNFIGTYFGRFSEPQVREYVESSDCIFCLGAVLTEMETGGYSANLPDDKLVLVTREEARVGAKSFAGVDFASFVEKLYLKVTSGELEGKSFTLPHFEEVPIDLDPTSQSLSVGSMLDQLNDFVDDSFAIVSDVGDCLYAGLSLKTDLFLAPGYYSSMGFGVPAGIGCQLASPGRRSIILVGDGGFQMTGIELAAAARLGINPIVILFNNSSYAMLRFIDQKRAYYDLGGWDYCAVAKGIGAQVARAESKAEFATALKLARASSTPFLIEAVITETDISPTLKRLTDHFGEKMRTTIS